LWNVSAFDPAQRALQIFANGKDRGFRSLSKKFSIPIIHEIDVVCAIGVIGVIVLQPNMLLPSNESRELS